MNGTKRILYLITGTLIMLLAGTVYTWTIISRSVSATFPDWSASALSMTFTFTMMFYAVGGLVSGMLLRRTGPRVTLASAALLFPGGMLLSSLAQTPVPLYLGFGIMCGMAAGLSYNTVVSVISAWFPDKKGVTSGILLAGFGLSSFIAGKLFAAFAPADGSRAWASGLRLLALLMLAALILGIALLHFPAPHETVSASSSRKKETRPPASDMTTGEMLRTSSFWFSYAWVSMLTACGLILVSQASGIAAETNSAVPGSTVATAVGMISVMNAAGRICTGLLFDRFGYRMTMLLITVSFGISAVLMLLALPAGSFPLLTAGFMLGGFAYGGNASISPPIIVAFYGPSYYAANLSLIPTNVIFTSFASVLAGRIYDRTHSYMGALILLLGAVILSAVLLIFLRRPGERRRKNG